MSALTSRCMGAALGLALCGCSAGGGTDTPGPTPSASPSGSFTATPTPGDASPSMTVAPSPSSTAPLITPTAGGTASPSPQSLGALRINEVVADNEGAWVDNEGETDDFFEIVNVSDEAVSTAGWTVGDDDDDFHPLPSVLIGPGEAHLFWADDEEHQGDAHLPFKLSAGGEAVYLHDPDGALADVMIFPALEPNDAWARFPDGDGAAQICRFASPGRRNGEQCGPPPPVDVVDDANFAPFDWPAPWPGADSPLTLNEIALKPAAFIEVLNTSDRAVALGGYQLSITEHLPGQVWPAAGVGALSTWPDDLTLAAGERVEVPVSEGDVAQLAAAAHEGVVTLSTLEGEVVSRLDFMAWPDGAILARQPDATGPFVFCGAATGGEANAACDPLAERDVGPYVRHLFTPGDFSALAYGDPKLGVESVKGVQDLDTGDHLYLLDSQTWDLHYTFVREVIDGDPHLDRCDPSENQLFNQGWYAFSVSNYYQSEGRRYLLPTLNRFGSNGLQSVEFSTGDVIVAEQMKHGLFTFARHVPEPEAWSLRAQDDRQVAEIRTVEGTVPAVGPNAPYEGMTFQALNEGVAFGTLRFIPAQELGNTTLGRQVIVVTDAVPLDIDLVGGLITEAFQTPLAHVAILSRNRGTPNMALSGAQDDPRLTPFFDTLVRLEVRSGDFLIREATSEEAVAFWESQGGEIPLQVPSLDASVGGLVDLADAGYEDLPAIGAKAALFAELYQVSAAQSETDLPIRVPEAAFAIPVSHYLNHFEASGAAAKLVALQEDPDFEADAAVRHAGLAEVRALMMAHEVDTALMAAVESRVLNSFGSARVRFRSSSNTEDIKGFSGAGLYTSVSGALGDDDRPIDDAIRTVWASLWSGRAYDERAYYNVDQSKVAMGVLVHAAFLSEEANGVGISRNILDPRRGSTYYINVQLGEATVTNPAPGVFADEFLYRWNLTPPEQYLSRSSFTDGQPVLIAYQRYEVATVLRDIHDGFRKFLDPAFDDPFYAVDIEFKYVEGEGDESDELWVKQARPYNFGSAAVDPCAEEAAAGRR